MNHSRPPGGTVVFLDHCARLSGGELALARLMPGLTRYRPHVILAEDGPLSDLLTDAGASVEVLELDVATLNLHRDRAGRLPPRGTSGAARYSIRLAKRLHALQPGVVHANSLKSGYYGSLATKIARIPLVWHLRDRLATDYMAASSSRVTRQAVRFGAQAVVANSRTTMATLGPGNSRQLRKVVYDPYKPLQPPRQSPRGQSTFTAGMVGRISPWKGQDVFLHALYQLRSRVPNLRARIIGEALFDEVEYFGQIRRLASDLGLDDIVEWRGFRFDVETELADLDVLVHCSTIPEPFGMVVIEGMAAGLPVVATAGGGPSEVIEEGLNGIMVPPNDPGALANALLGLLDPVVAAKIGAAAVEAAARYSPEVAGCQIEALYDQIRR